MYKSGYEYLLAYKITVPIYDYTVDFCQRWIDYKSRTKDQMEQAARSGMQNIPEGFKEQSLSNYIKLAGIARGSIEELLNDYLSYARQHQIEIWDKERARRKIKESSEIWEIITKTPTLPTSPSFPPLPTNPIIAVNLLVDLLKKAGYLQDKLIESLKEKHMKEGGFSENLFKKRLEYRNNK
jgi:restriction system protein